MQNTTYISLNQNRLALYKMRQVIMLKNIYITNLTLEKNQIDRNISIQRYMQLAKEKHIKRKICVKLKRRDYSNITFSYTSK